MPTFKKHYYNLNLTGMETQKSLNNSEKKENEELSSKQKVYWYITAKTILSRSNRNKNSNSSIFITQNLLMLWFCFSNCNNEKVIFIIQTAVVYISYFFSQQKNVLLGIKQKHKYYESHFGYLEIVVLYRLLIINLQQETKLKKIITNNNKLISTMQKS